MNKLSFQLPRQSLRTKLILYMLVLVFLLLVLLACCLSLFDRFKTPKGTLAERLDTQAMSFEKELLSHRNSLITVGTYLSEDALALIEKYLSDTGISFDGLSDVAHLTALQKRLIEPLRQYLLQADCSGAFIILNATAGSNSAEPSRSGLYLQVNGYEIDRREIILYRGSSSVGKEHGIMPHRKWRMETQSNVIPDWNDEKSNPSLPLALAYRFTDVFTLPGMSEKATLLMLPLRSSDGKAIGVCGFEMSESYFARLHSQSTKLPRFTGLMSYDDGDSFSAFLSCGSDDGYYYAPNGTVTSSDFGNGILLLNDDENSYLGMKRTYTDALTGTGFTTIVMTNKSDYDHAATDAAVKNIMLITLITALSVAFCIFFSRSYLSPVMRSLDRLKKDDCLLHRGASSEIDDLFTFLTEKDKDRQSVIDGLRREIAETDDALSKLHTKQIKLQKEYERAKAQITRLTASAMREADPEGYAHFTANLCRLTPKEREIFDLYLAGRNSKEIRELLRISENTLKYHNRHIYETLNVSSRKEMLRHASIMEKDSAANNTEADSRCGDDKEQESSV